MSYNNYYVNPLGEVKDISNNLVDNLKKNINNRIAQVEDTERKNKSSYLQLGLWSFTTAILILILLVMIRKIRDD